MVGLLGNYYGLIGGEGNSLFLGKKGGLTSNEEEYLVIVMKFSRRVCSRALGMLVGA